MQASANCFSLSSPFLSSSTSYSKPKTIKELKETKTMAAVLSPPSSGGLPKHSTLLLDPLSSSSSLPPWKSHAVNRTNELLSCARTALKIGQQQHKQRQQQLQLQQQSQQQQHQGSSIFKIKQQQSENDLPEWLIDVNPAQLTLYQQPPHYNDHYHTTTATNATAQDSPISLLSDSQSLLSLLDTNLSQLHTLVRKRGHTNDPTIQINNLIHKFNEAAQEMKQVCELLRLVGTMPPALHDDNSNNEGVAVNNNGRRTKSSSSKQRRKHYELVSSQLETYANERTDKLKKEMETRSQVLRDQTHRRKLLSTGGAGAGAGAVGGVASNTPPLSASTSTSTTTTRLAQPTRLPTTNSKSGGVGSNTNAASQFQSPLFTATSGGGASVTIGSQRRRNVNASTSNSTSATTATGGYSGYAGYGGVTSSSAPSTSTITTSSSATAPSFATGIRQRKQQQQQQSRIQIDHGNDDDKYNKDGSNSNGGGESVQQQIYERRQNRAAQSRLASARLAEKSIAELGVMFTKMSTLISQQGETLERIEDDVEAAGLDIDAGHDELVKVYGMTKGNRGLILKVFGILIFLIVFMKLY